MILLLLACGGERTSAGDAPPADAPFPEFGETMTEIGTAADGLANPRDLEFNPQDPSELWTVNQAIDGTVVFFEPGADTQTSEVLVDHYARHFMADPSALAFGQPGIFATCQESRDDWNDVPQPEDDFMGPTLWPSDLDTYCVVGQTDDYPPEGSHLDMLHESPWCMGITWEVDNVFWAFDGLHGDIVRYDFVQDHGAGGSDHSDGIVRRYTDAAVSRVSGVVSHMAFDGEGGLLVADTGTGRIMRLDTASGDIEGRRNLPNTDGLDEYSNVTGATWEVWAEGLDQPSGMAIVEDRVLVSEHGTGDIVAFDARGAELGRIATDAVGLQGITVGPEGHVWFADGDGNRVVRVDE